MAVSVGLAAVFIAVSSVLAHFMIRHLRVCYYISKFEGPPALPIVGNVYSFPKDQRGVFLQAKERLEEFRSSGGIYRLWIGLQPVVMVYDAKHMEAIMSSSTILTKGLGYRFLQQWLGTGLLTSTGKKWFRRRKMLTPTFHFTILQNFMGVFNEQSSILVKKLEKFADKPDPVNIFPLITSCVLDVICDTAMGKHINAQGDSDNEYVWSVKKMSELITKRSRKPWLWTDFVYDSVQDGKDQKRCLQILHGVTNKMIQERLRDSPKRLEAVDEEDEFDQKQKRVAFLDLLIQMHREDKSFTLDDIREEVDTFMFEGHDTTAAAVSWAVLLIAQHPDVQERLQEELDQVFGSSDRPVTSDDMSKLIYLNRVVKEALRVLPSVPVIAREVEEDVVVEGKLIPKGTEIWMHIYGLHRDPEWFPDPERFDPDRFLPENVEKRHPFAYVPFSAGPRNCIGQKFALMEDKVILANIFRRFSVEAVHETVDQAKPAGTLIIRPFEGEILVKFAPRK